jgi:hypothetical protein
MQIYKKFIRRLIRDYLIDIQCVNRTKLKLEKEIAVS